jgi:hypothetical protein
MNGTLTTTCYLRQQDATHLEPWLDGSEEYLVSFIVWGRECVSGFVKTEDLAPLLFPESEEFSA